MQEQLPKTLEDGPMSLAIWLVGSLLVAFVIALLV